ncbi:MmgE/PrpD family protein [Glutamicibacter sp. BW80]|uniref:MmgE/PrpD family protein n=1 Tax=Glutamicibacter sp. BW80 TaxID=2024404 RepID=UPI00159650FC|nr:MmgE/PrpD family protein [Glutamicibacter sp. BW80]
MSQLLIDRLVSHVLETPFEAFSSADINAAKMNLIDALGCNLSGRGAEGNDAVSQVLSNMGGFPQASILASDEKLPLAHAAMINSLQTRSFDFEVCGPEPEGENAGKMVGHVASTTVPVALNVGEFVNATGEQLLAATILGGDLAARISVSNTFNFDKDFEVCGTSNAFGAAAITGRLLGLTHDELRNAFGILINLLSGTYQGLWDGVASFKLPGATAAYNGILSCQLSQTGFKGVDDALESRLGFYHLYTPDPHPEDALIDLGQVFYVNGQHKLHPSCYGNHNAINCATELHEEHGLNAENIESVTLEVHAPLMDHFLNQAPTNDDDQARFLFSLPYALANSLHRGKPELGHFTGEAIRDPQVVELSQRVVLEPNLQDGFLYAAKIRVKTTDGKEIENTASTPPSGWLENPATYADIVEKFWRNVDFRQDISRENAQRALELLAELENVSDVSELAQVLSLETTEPELVGQLAETAQN